MKGSNRANNRPHPVDLYIKPCILQVETVLSFQSHIYRNWAWQGHWRSQHHTDHILCHCTVQQRFRDKSTSLHLPWMRVPWARPRGGRLTYRQAEGWRAWYFLIELGSVCVPLLFVTWRITWSYLKPTSSGHAQWPPSQLTVSGWDSQESYYTHFTHEGTDK